MFEQYKLTNGAKVILVPQKDTKSITIMVNFPVGSRYESDKMAGVSHYIEHLMFKGTQKRKNTLVLTREIDRLGAEYNAFTGKESTAYYIKVDGDFTKIALDILSDMLFNSLFDPKEMEREKGPIVEEIRMYKDNPIMYADTLFEDLLYAGCALGRDIAGSEKTVKSFQREDVLAFKNKHYAPGNMTIVAAGNINEKTKQLIAEYFDKDISNAKLNTKFNPFCFGLSKKDERLVIQEKKTDQVQMVLGFPGFSHNAVENPTLSIMNTILGGSMSSRLFIQIRERRGLAYMVRSGQEHFRDTGYVFVRAGLEAKNLNKAVAVIKSEIEKLVEKGITDRELRDAKTHTRGSVILSMEDSSAQAGWYSREAIFKDAVKTPEERLSEIDKVTASDVQKLTKKIFKMNEMRVAIIGDVKREHVDF